MWVLGSIRRYDSDVRVLECLVFRVEVESHGIGRRGLMNERPVQRAIPGKTKTGRERRRMRLTCEASMASEGRSDEERRHVYYYTGVLLINSSTCQKELVITPFGYYYISNSTGWLVRGRAGC